MRIVFAVITGLAATFAAPCLASTTVTWDETACAPLASCGNGSVVSQDYGDSAEVDLSYSTASGGSVRYWTGLYSNSSAIYADGGIGEVRIAPLSGLSLLLLSLDFGGWPNTARTISYSVFSDDFVQTLASGSVITNPAALTTVNFNISSSGPIRLQFGPDGFNGGIQNLRFSTSAGAIPEPSTWALLLLGFGFIGAAMRTAKRRQWTIMSYT